MAMSRCSVVVRLQHIVEPPATGGFGVRLAVAGCHCCAVVGEGGPGRHTEVGNSWLAGHRCYENSTNLVSPEVAAEAAEAADRRPVASVGTAVVAAWDVEVPEGPSSGNFHGDSVGRLRPPAPPARRRQPHSAAAAAAVVGGPTPAPHVVRTPWGRLSMACLCTD